MSNCISIIKVEILLQYLSLLWWWQTAEMIESLDLGNINILLQLPSAVLICKRPPAHKIMSDLFISDWITCKGNVKHTFNFHIVWVKWLLFFYL